jgi:hypothetical protein
MQPPSVFLADLPADVSLGPQTITEACRSLVRNQRLYLAGRDTESVLRSIASVAANWLEPADPFRQAALRDGPTATGFSRQVLETGLDDFFSRITLENLQDWVLQDFGHARRLDDFSASDPERDSGRHSMVCGPPLLAHVCAGNTPNPAFLGIIAGLIVRSAQFVKCSAGSSLLPRLFGHSLSQVEPKLGACLEIAEWKGGSTALENALFAEADCLTATGGDETLAALRAILPPAKRFIGYGHRLSFGYASQEALATAHPRKIAAAAADDIVAWDQVGCLSPHVIYVETGGPVAPDRFAQLLADELELREKSHPRGVISVSESAMIAIRRSVYELRASAAMETFLWRSENSTAWTVVFEAEPAFQMSCLYRFVYVKPSSSLEETLRVIDPIRGQVSTVGVAAPRHRLAEMARRFAQWGATRVCPLGKMQKPALPWRHDGRPVLAELTTWHDLES